MRQIACFALLLMCVVQIASGKSRSSQSSALADLTIQILECSTHPCIGDDPESEIGDQFVSDGTFNYSDIGVLFPSDEEPCARNRGVGCH